MDRGTAFYFQNNTSPDNEVLAEWQRKAEEWYVDTADESPDCERAMRIVVLCREVLGRRAIEQL